MRLRLAGFLLLAMPCAFAQQQEFAQLGDHAMAAVRAGRIEEAIPDYRRMLALDPGNASVRFDYALALNRLGRARESLSILGTTRDADSLALAGANYRLLGQTRNAINSLRRAFTLAPTPEIAHDLGLSLLAVESHAEAERVFRRYPDNARCLVGIGLVAYATGRNEEAKLAFEKAAMLEPKAADIYSSLGDLHHSAGAFDEAARSYESALRLAPMQADYHVKSARNLSRLNRDSDAVLHLRNALTIEPLEADANLELARLMGPNGSESDRRKLLETAIAADPLKPAGFYQLMLLCQKAQDARCVEFTRRNFEHLRDTKPAFQVDMYPPTVITEGPAAERRWGRYQFPVMHRLSDGRLIVFVHVEADSATAYGSPKQVFVSSDDGVSWRPDASAQNEPYGFRLRNGNWLRIDTPPSLEASALQLPERAGTFTSYRTEYSVYPMRTLAKELRQIFFQRFAGGKWQQQSAELDDPDGYRYTVQGRFPRIWWGDIQRARDGSLIAVSYPRIGATKPFRFGSACYRSLDEGVTWKMRSEIPFAPDLTADPKGASRDGFTEPALTVQRDGSLLALLRSTDGNGIGPMYQTRSTDLGRTWSQPKVMAPNGVLPRLLRLGNGILVLSSGRPGVQLRFQAEGQGSEWSAPWELIPQRSARAKEDTCSYTDLVALDQDSFLVVYSWFHKPDRDGNPRKTILARRVRVTRTLPGK
jgi:tetratricopeptide (TPR) repeat protein